MDEPEPFDDPGPVVAEPPNRIRRWLTVAVLLALIVSIVALAFVSGRGVVTVAPTPPPATTATRGPTAVATVSRLAIVGADGRLTTADPARGPRQRRSRIVEGLRLVHVGHTIREAGH